MAVTALEKRLLIGGEWVETGEWLEIRSPYSGDVIGRIPKGGTAETQRAVDAAARAMRDPLPAHKRAEIPGPGAGHPGKRPGEAPPALSQGARKPPKGPRREAA